VSLVPLVERRGTRLVADSGNLRQLLTLYSHRRQVEVDRIPKAIYVRDRMFWLFEETQEIPFEHVAEVRHVDGAVSLVLVDGEEIPLFRFPAPTTGGTYESPSRFFASQLAVMVGVEAPRTEAPPPEPGFAPPTTTRAPEAPRPHAFVPSQAPPAPEQDAHAAMAKWNQKD